MGRNMMPEWTLENGNTLFLASRSEGHEQPVTATFVCPIEGADISVSPGCSYIFSSYFGLHRTTGTIRLEFRSSEGEVVKVFETAIPKGLGGRQLSGYQYRQLAVKAPEDGATLRVQIIKGVTEKGEKDSFLFFTRPSLFHGTTGVGYEHLLHNLPEEFAIAAFATKDAAILCSHIPVPDLALDGNPHQLTFRHRPSGDATSVPVFVPDTALTRGKILGLEGSTLVARIDVEHSVFVSLWIDGQPVNERNASDAGSGTVRIPLPLAACDGNPHVFEIRRSVTGQVIDQFACLGPYSVTPWDALQRYSRMPLPGQLSAVAGYRYNSLSSEVAQNAPRSGLPHSRLHEILLEDLKRRDGSSKSLLSIQSSILTSLS